MSIRRTCAVHHTLSTVYVVSQLCNGVADAVNTVSTARPSSCQASWGASQRRQCTARHLPQRQQIFCPCGSTSSKASAVATVTMAPALVWLPGLKMLTLIGHELDEATVEAVADLKILQRCELGVCAL